MLSDYDFSVVRSLRKKQNLSIRQFAQKSGLTFPTVASIETNKTAPSLASLDQIASALDLTIPSLLVLCQKNTILKSSTRVLDIADLPADPKLENCRMAAYGDVRVFRVKGQQGMHTASVLEHGDVFELNYILSGTVEVTIKTEKHLLQQDETLFFDALADHKHQFVTDSEMLIVLIPKNQFSTHRLFNMDNLVKTDTATPDTKQPKP